MELLEVSAFDISNGELVEVVVDAIFEPAFTIGGFVEADAAFDVEEAMIDDAALVVETVGKGDMSLAVEATEIMDNSRLGVL